MQPGDLCEVLVEVQKKKDLPLSAVPGKASWKRLHFIWILKICRVRIKVEMWEP